MAAMDTSPTDYVVEVTATLTIPAHRLNEIGETVMAAPLGALAAEIGAKAGAALESFADALGSPQGEVVTKVAMGGGYIGAWAPEPAGAPE